MKRVRRRLLSGGLLGLSFLILAVLIAPWWLGRQIQQQLQNDLAALNRALPVKVTLLDYERGWVESHFVAQIHTPWFIEPLSSRHHLIHGPVYLGALNRAEKPMLLAWLESRRRGDSARLAELEPVKLRARWDLDGRWRADFELPLQHSALNEGGALQGAGWRARLDDNPSSGRSWLAIEDLEWDAAEYRRGRLSQLDLLLQRRGPRDWPPIGELQLDLASLEWLLGDEPVQAKDLALRAHGIADGELLNLDIEIATRSLRLGEREITAPRIQLLVRHLPLSLWQWLQGGVLKRLGEGELTVNEFVAKLLRGLPPEVEIEVARAVMELDGLPFEAWMRGTVCAPPQRADGATDWVRALCLSGELASEEAPLLEMLERETERFFHTETFGVAAELPPEDAAPLLRASAEAQLSVLTSAGYFEYRDGRYHTELQMRDGILSVRGQPFSEITFVR